jgi:hypothetical protein
MSVEEKQPFLDMAETLKRQHHIDHPDYKFKPKQRSTIGNKTIMKKNSSFTRLIYLRNISFYLFIFIAQRQFSTIIPSPPHCTSSSSSTSYSSLPPLSPMSNAAPHSVQSNVLAMCQAIIPSSSSENNNDWFFHLTGQPQSVIVAPIPRTQTSPISSRRAVRIQIINKHDDIAVPPPTLLPMTPPPPSSSLVINQSTPTLVDYFVNSCNMFSIPTSNNQQVLTAVMDDPNGKPTNFNYCFFYLYLIEYETLHDSSVNHLTDLDQQYDSSGWIDTPLSNFGTNSTDMVSSSPYSSYDFLCL